MLSAASRGNSVNDIQDIERGERWGLVFAVVVEQDGLRFCGCDGHYCCGGVEGAEGWGEEVEEADGFVAGLEVPDAEGVVEGGGEEGVGCWVHGHACYGAGVAAEVFDEGVVVGGEVADVI